MSDIQQTIDYFNSEKESLTAFLGIQPNPDNRAEKGITEFYRNELIHNQMALEAIRELEQYRSIGTVEECREAVEKQKAIARVVEAGEYYCPKCNHPAPYAGYCKCGQKIY